MPERLAEAEVMGCELAPLTPGRPPWKACVPHALCEDPDLREWASLSTLSH